MILVFVISHCQCHCHCQTKRILFQHFVGGNGPTRKYPDPVPADGGKATAFRDNPKRKKLAQVRQTR